MSLSLSIYIYYTYMILTMIIVATIRNHTNNTTVKSLPK